MRRLLTTVFILLLFGAGVLIAGLLLAPEHVQRVWSQAGAPTELLDMALNLGGRAPALQPQEQRLYGVLEARETHAMSEIAGRVTAILVEEGEWVEAGEALARLDPAIVEADVAAAEEALVSARLARDAAAAPPDPALVAVADAKVGAAETRLQNAQRTLARAQEDLAQPLALDAEIHRIRTLIPAAQAAVGKGEAQVSGLDVLLQQARTDGSREGKFLQALYEKQKAAAAAEIDAANARLQGLQRALTLLQQMRKQPLVLQAQLHQAEQGVAVAEADLAVARAERDVAAAAPSPESVAVAEAQVQKAEAALALAQWKQRRLTVVAPSGGRVLQRMLEPGERVAPGAPLFTIADLDQLEARVYVAAIDLHRVTVGDDLAVETPALPGRRLTGRVFYIAPEAQFRPSNVLNPDDRGDMVFLVKLRLANEDGRLKPGMPVDVLLPLGGTDD